MPADFADAQRRLRIACAPAPHTKGATLRVCADCGASFWDWLSKTRQRCPDCSAQRAREQRATQAAWAAARRS